MEVAVSEMVKMSQVMGLIRELDSKLMSRIKEIEKQVEVIKQGHPEDIEKLKQLTNYIKLGE
jgi:hypothetical protein